MVKLADERPQPVTWGGLRGSDFVSSTGEQYSIAIR